MTAPGRIRLSERGRFALWALVGAGGLLALLTILSIGIFVALVVAMLAVTLLHFSGVDRSVLGAVSGVSVPLFYVAWLNRDGPGEVCRVQGRVTECAERWSPWPWLMVGLAFLAAGIAVFHRLGRLRPSA